MQIFSIKKDTPHFYFSYHFQKTVSIVPEITSNNKKWGIIGYSLSYLECHSTCYRCVYKFDDNCTACIDDRYLHITECLTNCPSGFFENTIL